MNEAIKIKINNLLVTIFKNIRNKRLKNKDFTIISNNCWAGTVYESFNLPKLSPTIGLFIMPNDYLKFIKDIKKYLRSEIKFIKAEDSKNYEFLKRTTNVGTYPIGVLKDIEIYFLHYKDENQVIDKWRRRCDRINFNKIIYKFNDQNLCKDEEIIEFLNLPLKNKICFTARDLSINNPALIKIKQKKKDFVLFSNEPIIFKKYFNLIEYINNL